MNHYGAPPSEGRIVTGFADITDTAATEVIAAPGPSSYLMLTLMVTDNAHASTNSRVKVYSGSTAKTGWLPAASGDGGHVIRFDPPLPMNLNEPAKVAFGAACTGSVTLHGYIASAKGQ